MFNIFKQSDHYFNKMYTNDELTTWQRCDSNKY